HPGPAVPVPLVFLLIDRAPPRWSLPPLVWAALAWTALADAMTIFVAVLPVTLACTTGLVKTMTGRDPGSRFPAGQQAALAVAAVLAAPAELLAAALIRALGGWQAGGLRTALAGAGQLPGNARLAGAG